MIGLPPSGRTERRCMSPTPVSVRGLRAPSADAKRLDIIRDRSRSRPVTPATIGDPGRSMQVKTFSSFSPGGTFNASVVPVRDISSPMDRSRAAAEKRKAKKMRLAVRADEHEVAALAYKEMAEIPKALFQPSQVLTSGQGTVPMLQPESILPKRAETPDGLPPRPQSRQLQVKIGGASRDTGLYKEPSDTVIYRSGSFAAAGGGVAGSGGGLSRPSSAASVIPSPNPHLGGRQGGSVGRPNSGKPPRPHSAFSQASVGTNLETTTIGGHSIATSESFRPLSATPVSPLQSLARQSSEMRLNEVLRTGSGTTNGTLGVPSEMRAPSAAEIRPLRSFVC